MSFDPHVAYNLTYYYHNTLKLKTLSRYNLLEKRHDCSISVMALDDGKSNRLPDSGNQAAAATSGVSPVYMAKCVGNKKSSRKVKKLIKS